MKPTPQNDPRDDMIVFSSPVRRKLNADELSDEADGAQG